MRIRVVAAVITASIATGAQALDPATTFALPATQQLTVVAATPAGGGDFHAAFFANFTQMCTLGTAHLYRASPVVGQDFRAVSCTLLNAAPVPAALRGINFVVYYRVEGPSVWGPASIAKGIQLQRLDVTPVGCTGVGGIGPLQPYPTPNDCNNVNYSGLVTDLTFGSHLVKDTTDLALTEMEPAMFRGENWPTGEYIHNEAGTSGVAFSEPTPGTMEGTSVPRYLNPVLVHGQTFGVLVNSGLVDSGSAPVTSISQVDVATILQGGYSDWSQVRSQTSGLPVAAGPITVCRREIGGSSQLVAAMYFLQQNCHVSFEPSVTAPIGPNGNTVVMSTLQVPFESCVGTNPGAIGSHALRTFLPAGTKYLAINRVAPNAVLAAAAEYNYSTEVIYSRSVTPAPPFLVNTLIDTLIARARTSTFSTPSFFLLPNVAGNVPTIPVAGVNPMALWTRGGIACKAALGQM